MDQPILKLSKNDLLYNLEWSKLIRLSSKLLSKSNTENIVLAMKAWLLFLGSNSIKILGCYYMKEYKTEQYDDEPPFACCLFHKDTRPEE